MDQPTTAPNSEQPKAAADPPKSSMPDNKKPEWLSWLYVGIVVVAAVVAGWAVWVVAQQTNDVSRQTQENQPQYGGAPAKSTEVPKLTTEVVLTGRDHVWEVVFLPSKEMLFTERSGKLSMLKDGQVTVLADIEDVYARGEGGLMGMAVDSSFNENRYLYTCFNSTKGSDVRVVRWKVKTDLSGLEDRSDIITGMPSNVSGRHSGCRLAFGPDGYLWVGTGDAAQGDAGVQPKNLGGKVLRVDRDGKAADNGLGGEYDPRIYSYGHRNVQGLAFYKSAVGGVLGVSVEHGSNVDDEVNLLQTGNFGWAPPATGYNETGVAMTDKNRFPDAIEAIWESGSPTQAPSGATFVRGRQWKAWDGALMIAMLRSQHLKVLTIADNKVTKEEKTFEGTFGRMRAAVQGPDGNLYISTDNGSTDQIVRIIPN